MKRYKRKFTEKYESFYMKKDFGKGFVLEEMATVKGFDQFINKGKKDFKPDSEEIVNRKGWNEFQKFLKEVKKYHNKSSGLHLFFDIINQDKITQKLFWDSLSDEDQNRIIKLAKYLDDKKII